MLREKESSLYRVHLTPHNIAERVARSWQTKIIDYNKAPDLLSQFFAKVGWVLITGCWDNPQAELHPGHRSLLTTMKHDFNMPTVVGVESDQTIYFNKGFLRPFRSTDKRAEAVAKLPEVDYVIIFPQTITYGAPDKHSQSVVTERIMNLTPPNILIDAEDPSNPYPFSQNKLAKELGLNRLVFTKIGSYSTSRIRGY